MNKVYEKSLELHREKRGKLEMTSKVEINNFDDLSLAYSPGVAEPCRAIVENEEASYQVTNRSNLIAIVSDGSAVLGLGNIGATAAMPVMEGKAVLFKRFANVDAIPLCIDVHDEEGICQVIKALEPSFGGILMEDISAPKCVSIERRLKNEMNIPVFHDDQHGTAIIAIAALINILRLTKKKKEELRVVISGAGAAGSSIIKLMSLFGIRHIEAFDIQGQIRQKDKERYDFLKQELLACVNLDGQEYPSMKEAFVKADVFIGVSAPNLVTKEMVASMNEKCAVLAMANPTPEIDPKEAAEAGAYIIGTGRSDYPNQINNVLVFPGLFRGALDSRAKTITEKMKLAAAEALAYLISDEELSRDYLIPSVFDSRVASCIAKEVMRCAQESGNVRKG